MRVGSKSSTGPANAGYAGSSFRERSRCCDERLRERLVQLAREKPRYDYRRFQGADGARWRTH